MLIKNPIQRIVENILKGILCFIEKGSNHLVTISFAIPSPPSKSNSTGLEL